MQERLNEVKNIIDAIQKVEEAENFVYDLDVNSSVNDFNEAEKKIDGARRKVKDLNDLNLKKELNERLDLAEIIKNQQLVIQLLEEAENLLELTITDDVLIEVSNKLEKIDDLMEYTENLITQVGLNGSIDLEELKQDIEDVKNKYNELILISEAQKKVKKAENAVESFESNPSEQKKNNAQNAIDSARNSVSKISEGVIKDSLNNRLDELQNKLDSVKIPSPNPNPGNPGDGNNDNGSDDENEPSKKPETSPVEILPESEKNDTKIVDDKLTEDEKKVVKDEMDNIEIDHGQVDRNEGNTSIEIDLKDILNNLSTKIGGEELSYRLDVFEYGRKPLVYTITKSESNKIIIPNLKGSTLYDIQLNILDSSNTIAVKQIVQETRDITSPVIEKVIIKNGKLEVIATDNKALHQNSYQYIVNTKVLGDTWTGNSVININQDDEVIIRVQDHAGNLTETMANIHENKQVINESINSDKPKIAIPNSSLNITNIFNEMKLKNGLNHYEVMINNNKIAELKNDEIKINDVTGDLIVNFIDKKTGEINRYRIEVIDHLKLREIGIQKDSITNLPEIFNREVEAILGTENIQIKNLSNTESIHVKDSLLQADDKGIGLVEVTNGKESVLIHVSVIENNLDELVKYIDYINIRKQETIENYSTEQLKTIEENIIAISDHTITSLPVNNIIARNAAIKFEDMPPIIKNSRTLLPVRAISESLGANVRWDEASQKVTIIKDNKIIDLIIGQKEAIVNGVKVQLDAAAEIIGNRTYLPIRFISETLGYRVLWEPNSMTVDIID